MDLLSRHNLNYATFAVVDIKIRWEGSGENEKGINVETNKIVAAINSKYYRPAEVELLWGDSSLAKKDLGWSPKVSFSELVRGMVEYDLKNDNYGGQE